LNKHFAETYRRYSRSQIRPGIDRIGVIWLSSIDLCIRAQWITDTANMSLSLNQRDGIRRRASFVFGLLVAFQVSCAWGQGLTEATVHIDRAVIAYEEKKFDAALKELQAALKLEPDNIEALYYEGIVYASLNRPKEAQTSLERARRLRPANNDIAFQLGALHFNQEAYEQAEPLLRQVFRSEPNRPNLGYYLGFIEYRKKNYREALRFFEANVPSDNNFAQLTKFYSGLAMTSLGFPREGQGQIEQALQLQPTSSLTAPAQKFGEILTTAAQREKFFNGELRLGLYYDTNVPVVPVSSSDLVTQAIQDDQGRRKSSGELVSLNLSYTFLKKLDWEGAISYRFLQTYNNHLTEFNTQDHTPTIALAYRSSWGDMPLIYGSQFSYDFITLGNTRFSQRWILNPYVTLVESQSADVSHSTTMQFRFQAKDFFHDEDVIQGPPVGRSEVRDALGYSAGPVHFVVFGEGRHFLKLGYQFDYDNAEGNNWTYSGNRLIFGAQYTLPPWGWDMRLRYDLEVSWRSYKYKNTLLPATAPGTVKQRAREPVILLGAHKDFLANLTGSLEYLFDWNRSNLDPYTYKRHVITTSLTWRF
jgi:tetratricopeptide (TPR) repeat protein